jgi:predicted DNA-binding ribbon-helix-helix protein
VNPGVTKDRNMDAITTRSPTTETSCRRLAVCPSGFTAPRAPRIPAEKLRDCSINRQETRPIHIGNVQEKMRLEPVYWTVLELIARGQCKSLDAVLTTWWIETELMRKPKNWTFASFVRASCVMHVTFSWRSAYGPSSQS